MKYFIVTLICIVLGVTALVIKQNHPQSSGTAVPAATVSALASPNPSTTPAADNRYLTYTPQLFQANSSKRRVLFFHASWCPTCKAANLSFEQNLSRIPSDVILLKTDYDTQNELKQTYAITYQHTFIQVDSSGNPIAKWNGGDIDELLANIK